MVWDVSVSVCVCAAFSLSLFVCFSVYTFRLFGRFCHIPYGEYSPLIQCVAQIYLWIHIHKDKNTHTQTICDESQTFYYASSNYSDVWQMQKVSESNRFHSLILFLIPHLTSIPICVSLSIVLLKVKIDIHTNLHHNESVKDLQAKPDMRSKNNREHRKTERIILQIRTSKLTNHLIRCICGVSCTLTVHSKVFSVYNSILYFGFYSGNGFFF